MNDAMGRRGLGRGLSALLDDPEPNAGKSPDLASAATELPIELLQRNPDQPRRSFSDVEMEELTSSVREKGVLQPILVRPAPGKPGEYQIVAGERRWRAAQAARLTTIPAVVKSLNDLDVLEIGIIENVQRADLNPLEEAQGYRSLIDRFGRTQEQVAVTVGKSRAHVANGLRLLAMPESVRTHIMEGRLTAGHARAIATADDIQGLADRIVARGLSVRQAELLGREGQPSAARPRSGRSSPPAPAKDPDTVALEQDISTLLGLVVAIEDQGGVGEVRIRYETLEQLDDLCRKLTDA